jgi:hypothetical protein
MNRKRPERQPDELDRLMDEAVKDPEASRARQLSEQQEKERNWAMLSEAEQPIVLDLAAAGSVVTSVYDYLVSPVRELATVRVLLDHLQRKYPARIREGIARALATTPLSRAGWPIILNEFLTEPDESVHGPKWALGLCLGLRAGPEHIADVLKVVVDVSHGHHRAPLVEALGRMRSTAAREALKTLIDDNHVGRDAVRVLKRLS